jgi:large subunit ribosomal protein L32
VAGRLRLAGEFSDRSEDEPTPAGEKRKPAIAGDVYGHPATIRALMAVPKKRTSRTRRDKRRATHKVSAARLNECPRCHSPRLPHRVCPVCGTYAGREVISHEIAEPQAPAAPPEQEE